MSDKLKPCPFCGSLMTVEKCFLGDPKYMYFARCSNGDCIGYNMEEQDEQGGVYVGFASIEDAIRASNTRPIEDALRDALTAAGEVIEHARCNPAWAEEYYEARNKFVAAMKKVEAIK